jgi:flagellar M-ring protein FliF
VNRLSVSLLLDESVAEQQATDLQSAVSAAVGLDAARGDLIAVSRLAFDRAALEEAQAAFASESSLDQYLGYARLVVPVLALVIGFVLFRMMLGALAGTVPAGAVATAVVGGAPLASGLPPRAPLPGVGLPEIAPRQQSAALPPPEETRSEVERHVQSMAQGRPEAVAEVVQAWLREE